MPDGWYARFYKMTEYGAQEIHLLFAADVTNKMNPEMQQMQAEHELRSEHGLFRIQGTMTEAS